MDLKSYKSQMKIPDRDSKLVRLAYLMCQNPIFNRAKFVTQTSVKSAKITVNTWIEPNEK